jgi:hypothetical protein
MTARRSFLEDRRPLSSELTGLRRLARRRLPEEARDPARPHGDKELSAWLGLIAADVVAFFA